MTRVDEKFAETFGIPQISRSTSDMVSVDEIPAADNAKGDFEFVRQTLYSLLKNGSDAFEQLAEIAKVEEKISAYGTMNEMLGNLSDISIKLLEIHERKKKMEASTKPETPAQVTNNNVYVGSASDLDKLLESGDIIDV